MSNRIVTGYTKTRYVPVFQGRVEVGGHLEPLVPPFGVEWKDWQGEPVTVDRGELELGRLVIDFRRGAMDRMGCSKCALGWAIDHVGRSHGRGGYDWIGVARAHNHQCPNIPPEREPGEDDGF